tara:strand:- start:33 stop:395 length:363 start_codon:yes stop_codon:yes gene_type:complete
MNNHDSIIEMLIDTRKEIEELENMTDKEFEIEISEYANRSDWIDDCYEREIEILKNIDKVKEKFLIRLIDIRKYKEKLENMSDKEFEIEISGSANRYDWVDECKKKQSEYIKILNKLLNL